MQRSEEGTWAGQPGSSVRQLTYVAPLGTVRCRTRQTAKRGRPFFAQPPSRVEEAERANQRSGVGMLDSDSSDSSSTSDSSEGSSDESEHAGQRAGVTAEAATNEGNSKDSEGAISTKAPPNTHEDPWQAGQASPKPAEEAVTTSGDPVVTRRLLDNMVRDFVAKLERDRWGHRVQVEGLPKGFSFRALEAIMLGMNQQTFEVCASAVGAAYMRNHEDVLTEDASSALDVKSKGVEQFLPTSDDGWG